jgi:large subunit ribosomal protein L4
MAKTKVITLNGTEKNEITLKDEIWNIEINEVVMSDAIRLQMASLRQGTHKTKDRSEVSGGGKKPWRQKGTGRARQGSTRAPHWVGGGIVFGPTPRDYGFKMNKKERRLALKSALSEKFQNKKLCVVDSLELKSPKTKEFISVLNTLKLEGKTLIVTDGENGNVALAAGNVQNLYVIEPTSINVLDLVSADNLLIDETSVAKIEEVLK